MKKIIFIDILLYLICIIALFIFMSLNYIGWSNFAYSTIAFLIGGIFIYFKKFIFGYCISIAPVVGYSFEFFTKVDYCSKAAIIGTKSMLTTIVIGIILELIRTLINKIIKGNK